jgi:hypothetical protein
MSAWFPKTLIRVSLCSSSIFQAELDLFQDPNGERMISDPTIAGYALLTKRDKAINAGPLQLMQSTDRDIDHHNPSGKHPLH